MKQDRVDMYVMTNQKYLPAEKIVFVKQENICQGGFHHKDEIPPINWKLSYTSVRVTAAF